MRRSIWLSSAALVLVLVIGGVWWNRHRTAARRLAAWEEQREEVAAWTALDRQITFAEGSMPLSRFAALIAERSGLAVELDEDAIEADPQGRGFLSGEMELHLVPGTFSLHAALALHLELHGLAGDVRQGRLVITTLDQATNRTGLVPVVYPLPQPEPGGIDEQEWAEIITGNIDQGGWDSVGGQAHVEAVPGALVIVQTPAAHRRIRALIKQLSGIGNPPNSLTPVPLVESSETERDKLIHRTLDEPAFIDCHELPLRDLAQLLSKRHSIPIFVQEGELEKAGLRRAPPVTMRLRGISLRSLLRIVLNDLNLTFIIRNGVLLITTGSDAAFQLDTIAYPVQDLVGTPNGPDFAPLIDLITTIVAPPCWSEVGGFGKVSPLGADLLIISQIDDIHEEIEQLLSQIRRALSVSKGPPHLPGHRVTPASERVIEALQRPIAMRFQATPLKDVCDLLQTTLDIPVVASPLQLQWVSAAPDLPITCDLAPASLREQLRRILEPHQLAFHVREEVLQITSVYHEQMRLSTRLYDLRALADPDSGIATEEELRRLVFDVGGPYHWSEGNGLGLMKMFRGLLVVAHSDTKHQTIQPFQSRLNEHCLQRCPIQAYPNGVLLLEDIDTEIWAYPVDDLTHGNREEVQQLIASMQSAPRWMRGGKHHTPLGQPLGGEWLVVRTIGPIHQRIPEWLDEERQRRASLTKPQQMP